MSMFEEQSIPPQTTKIYEQLVKGNFISSNAGSNDQRVLYDAVEEHYEVLRHYFAPLGYELMQGDGFFYFSKSFAGTSLEQKIEQAFKWIDIIDFCKSFNASFTAGFRFRLMEIAEEVRVNVELEEKLKSLPVKSQSGKTIDQIRSIFRQLESNGPFVVRESEVDESYKVLSSFAYLEQLVDAIVLEDVDTEQ